MLDRHVGSSLGKRASPVALQIILADRLARVVRKPLQIEFQAIARMALPTTTGAPARSG